MAGRARAGSSSTAADRDNTLPPPQLSTVYVHPSKFNNVVLQVFNNVWKAYFRVNFPPRYTESGECLQAMPLLKCRILMVHWSELHNIYPGEHCWLWGQMMSCDVILLCWHCCCWQRVGLQILSSRGRSVIVHSQMLTVLTCNGHGFNLIECS